MASKQLRIKPEPYSASSLSLIPQIPQQTLEEDFKGDIVSSNPIFNLQDAITKLIDSKYPPPDTSTDPAIAFKKLADLKPAITKTAAQCRGGRDTPSEQWEKVNLFLYTLSCLPTVTPTFRYESISLIAFVAIQ